MKMDIGVSYWNLKCCIRKWVIVCIFLAIHLHLGECGPAQKNITRTPRQLFSRPNEQITIGPCRWIINKKCPDIDVGFYLYTRKNVQDRQYIFIDNSWESSNLSTSNFDPAHPTKIIIHGYNADMFIHPLIQMKDEYFQRGDYNLIFVDWSSLALAPCYPAAARNTRHTGVCISQLIERILESGTDNIHLIGFSLGAQVTNFVARSLNSFQLPRITGLDPAMPLFITANNDNKLDASDAKFVDVIHTNALVQAKIERCGHADFYMNGGIIQPGCRQNEGNIFACSHHRAPDYFSESITSLRGFWGWPCSSYISYLLGLCPPTNLLSIAGEDCKPNTRGMFLITTNSAIPFATGRWTDIPDVTKRIFSRPHSRIDPFQGHIDRWGKLEGTYNNLPYSFDNSNDLNTNNLFSTDPDGIIQNENTFTTNRDDLRSDLETPSKLQKNAQFVSKVKTLYEQRKNEKLIQNFVEMYKRNLSNGFISDDIFQIPEVTLS